MIEVWAHIKRKDGSEKYERVATYANNCFREYRGWYKDLDILGDGLVTMMA